MNTDQVNPFAPPPLLAPESPGRKWLSVDSPALRRTGLGLAMVYFGIIILLLSVLLAVFAAAFLGPAGMAIFLAAVLLGVLLLIVGPLLCLAVPAESGAKNLIVGSVICQLISVAAQVTSGVVADADVARLGQLAGNLLNIVGCVLFILFMRRLAQYIGRDDLADRAKHVLVLGCVLIAAMIVCVGAMSLSPMGSSLIIVVAILGLVTFAKYANLINDLRKVLWR